MTEQKEWDMPADCKNMWLKEQAYEALGKFYALVPFGFKRALHCFNKQQELNSDAWGMFFQLYPRLRNGNNEYTATVWNSKIVKKGKSP